MSIFSNNLKNLRIQHGYTQKKLADKLDVSQNAVYNWENGKREPGIETIEKIADALDVTVFEILGYNNPSWVDLFSGGASCANVSIEETLKELGLTSDDLQSLVDNQKENEKELLTIYRKLNDTGQEKALEQVEMLTKIEEYTKKED